jgi:hypothetical protein
MSESSSPDDAVKVRHDIKNHLSAIHNFAEILEKSKATEADPNLKNYTEKIKQRVWQIITILEENK